MAGGQVRLNLDLCTLLTIHPIIYIVFYLLDIVVAGVRARTSWALLDWKLVLLGCIRPKDTLATNICNGRCIRWLLYTGVYNEAKNFDGQMFSLNVCIVARTNWSFSRQSKLTLSMSTRKLCMEISKEHFYRKVRAWELPRNWCCVYCQVA